MGGLTYKQKIEAAHEAMHQQVKQMTQMRAVVRVCYCGLQGWGIVVSSRGVDTNNPNNITVRTATGVEVDVPWTQIQPELDPDILACAEKLAKMWWGANEQVHINEAMVREKLSRLRQDAQPLTVDFRVKAMTEIPPLIVENGRYDATREDSRAEGAEGAEMIATIRYKPLSEGRPAFGHTVGIWMKAFNIVIRGYRDARAETDWRVAGTDGMPIDERHITGWTELPAGCLPPPDGGAA